VVALRNLRSTAGTPISASGEFAKILSGATPGGPGGAALAALEKRLLKILRSDASVGTNGLYLAWDFTVISRSNLTGPILAMRDAADAYRQVLCSTNTLGLDGNDEITDAGLFANLSDFPVIPDHLMQAMTDNLYLSMNYSILLPWSVDFVPLYPFLDASYPNEETQELILVLLQMAFGDHQVSNFTTEIEARTLRAVVHEPALPAALVSGDPFYGLAAAPATSRAPCNPLRLGGSPHSSATARQRAAHGWDRSS